MTMHHIISDGWSTGVFTRELNVLYAAYAQGEVSPLAPLPIQYADYALWQRGWLQGEVLERQLSYWRERLQDLQTLQLPTDRVRPAVASFQGAVLPISLDSVPTLKEFKAKHDMGVDLLSDFKRDVSRAYDVLLADKFFSKRAYFLIDKQGVLRWAHTEMELGHKREDGELLRQIAALDG